MLDAGIRMLNAGFLEGVHFSGSRWQAIEIQTEASDEDFGRGGGRRSELGGFEFGEDEVVDFVLGPGLVFYGGQSRPLWRDVAPVLESFKAGRPLSTGFDPISEVIDLHGGKAVAAFGHGILVLNGQSHPSEDIITYFKMVRRCGVEAQVTFVLFRTVALEAGTL